MPNFGDEPPLAFTPHLAYFDTNMGVGFEPHVWIDISATMDVKRRMLAAHESQAAMEDRLYGAGPLAMMELAAQFRGAQRATQFAEAFRGCETYPEPDGAIRFLVRTLEGA